MKRTYNKTAGNVRFREKVDVKGPVQLRVLGACHVWTGAISDTGYGVFRREDGRLVGAHRYAFELAYGRKPARLVLHRCDNKACVRPSHLFEGTSAENVRDMDRKGRRVNAPKRGEAHGRAILTEKAVREARALWDNQGKTGREASGMTVAKLAERFGVSPTTMHEALVGRKWAHVR